MKTLNSLTDYLAHNSATQELSNTIIIEAVGVLELSKVFVAQDKSGKIMKITQAGAY